MTLKQIPPRPPQARGYTLHPKPSELGQALVEGSTAETEPFEPQVHDEGASMTKSETGGFKQAKLAQFSLIPPAPLRELAELYGRGAQMYAANNYLKGYKWSLSYDAASRHLNDFWAGEDVDVQTQTKHVLNCAWHCLALAEFLNNPERYAEYDDRLTTAHPQDAPKEVV